MRSQKNASSHKSQKDGHSKVRQRKAEVAQPKKTSLKKVSAKKIAEKVVKVLKPQAQSKQDLKLANQQEKKAREKMLDVPFAESSAMTTSTKFFYTSDELISNFDDQQLYDMASKQFPGLLATEKNDNARKNAILSMLNDIEFMDDVLEQYNMTILDFFKFLFRLCPSTFKGMFVRKLQNALKDKPYAQSIKFGNYKSRDQRKRTKRCSIF